jgi:hypothetical protein
MSHADAQFWKWKSAESKGKVKTLQGWCELRFTFYLAPSVEKKLNLEP